MTQLSVNLNKVALIRNSRGRNEPDLVQVAKDCVEFGADGITLHPRPDERHARKQDVYDLKPILSVELNVEGYPSEAFLQMIEAVKPGQCTLVPDSPGVLTSNAGWDTQKHKHFLLDILLRIEAAGVRSSLFMATGLSQIEIAREIGSNRIELYTEPYAQEYPINPQKAVDPYTRAASFAHEIGLGINAGHDLSLQNLAYFAEQVPHLDEVSIGHALVGDALYLGFQEAIRKYQRCLGKSV